MSQITRTDSWRWFWRPIIIPSDFALPCPKSICAATTLQHETPRRKSITRWTPRLSTTIVHVPAASFAVRRCIDWRIYAHLQPHLSIAPALSSSCRGIISRSRLTEICAPRSDPQLIIGEFGDCNGSKLLGNANQLHLHCSSCISQCARSK